MKFLQKKLVLLLALVMILSVVVTSCGKDKDPDPEGEDVKTEENQVEEEAEEAEEVEEEKEVASGFVFPEIVPDDVYTLDNIDDGSSLSFKIADFYPLNSVEYGLDYEIVNNYGCDISVTPTNLYYSGFNFDCSGYVEIPEGETGVLELRIAPEVMKSYDFQAINYITIGLYVSGVDGTSYEAMYTVYENGKDSNFPDLNDFSKDVIFENESFVLHNLGVEYLDEGYGKFFTIGFENLEYEEDYDILVSLIDISSNGNPGVIEHYSGMTEVEPSMDGIFSIVMGAESGLEEVTEVTFSIEASYYDSDDAEVKTITEGPFTVEID